MSLVSVPRQLTLSNQMSPAPLVKPEYRATEPIANDFHNNDTFDDLYVIHTSGSKSKLSAGHISISNTPGIITNSSPLLLVTDFHTPSPVISTTLQSDISLVADCCRNIHLSQLFLLMTLNLHSPCPLIIHYNCYNLLSS